MFPNSASHKGYTLFLFLLNTGHDSDKEFDGPCSASIKKTGTLPTDNSNIFKFILRLQFYTREREEKMLRLLMLYSDLRFHVNVRVLTDILKKYSAYLFKGQGVRHFKFTNC